MVHFVLSDQFYLFDCFTCEVVKKNCNYIYFETWGVKKIDR